jgi:predicted transcriptional regulator
MKEYHLTVRLSAALERALNQRARDTNVPRSQLVREAMTTYLAGSTTPVDRVVTAAELAARWPALPPLARGDAERFGEDLVAARKRLPAPRPWE